MPTRTPDGPDGLAGVSTTNAPAQLKVVDSIVAQHGQYFFVEPSGAKAINRLAVAASFAVDLGIYYDRTAGGFRQYEAAHGCFAQVDKHEVKWKLGEFLMDLAIDCKAEDFLPKLTNSLNSILNLVRGYVVPADPEFASRNVFHVGNGMLAITAEGASLLPFDTRYRSTTFCPVKYLDGAACPRFLNDLLAPAVVPEDIDLLQRWLGSLLIGKNDAQRFMVLYGAALAGKSTVVDIAEQILGHDRVASLRTQHLSSSRFETHAFLNKTLLTAKDVPSDFLSTRGAGMIKALTGNDVVDVERKGGGRSKLRGNLNLVVTSNARPQLRFDDDDSAWRRRLLVIGFERKMPPQRIPNFAQQLLSEEGEGILAWMVDGAVNHLRELADGGDFVLTPGQTERIESLLNESRSAEYFVSNRIAFEVKSDVSVEEIRRAYFDYCEARGWHPLTPRQLENVLGDLMLTIHSSQKRTDIRRGGTYVRGFKNVALKAE
jgi:P4 family phage/plasmid primase-like protien